MKLLHVISSMNPRAGGPCQGVRNLAPYVCDLGNTVEVVALDDPNSDYIADETIPIHVLGKGRGPWCYQRSLRPWLERNVSRFDAVILNGMWQYPGYAMSCLARRPETPPYYVFPHGMLDPWFQRASERRFKAVRNWVYWKLIERRVVQNAGALFYTCSEEMRLAQETFRPFRPKRQVAVGYGVSEPPRFHQGMTRAFMQKCPDVGSRPYFLFLGRIHPKKAIDLLIQAYAALCRSRTDGEEMPPCLVIAGPGIEETHGQILMGLAERICPLGSVLWPGMLAGDAKWGALYNAEAFVLASHQENFGIAVVEAMACGTPVLISNQINIWREIEDDNAGFVCNDTFDGIGRLLQRWEQLSPVMKGSMKHAARWCYKNRFGIAQAARRFVDTLQELSIQRSREQISGKKHEGYGREQIQCK